MIKAKAYSQKMWHRRFEIHSVNAGEWGEGGGKKIKEGVFCFVSKWRQPSSHCPVWWSSAGSRGACVCPPASRECVQRLPTSPPSGLGPTETTVADTNTPTWLPLPAHAGLASSHTPLCSCTHTHTQQWVTECISNYKYMLQGMLHTYSFYTGEKNTHL